MERDYAVFHCVAVSAAIVFVLAAAAAWALLVLVFYSFGGMM